jgi:SPP1 gp7 family putative phage head morphogenesis protein
MLRRALMAEFRRRFNRLAKDIIQLVEIEDAFGLRPQKRAAWLGDIVINERWRFLTSTQKVSAFTTWLKHKYAEAILQTQETANKYWEKYVLEGYKKGAGKAWAAVRKIPGFGNKEADAFYQGGKAEFLRDAFAQPETIEKVKLMASRVLTDLEGVTQTMATKMSRVLTDGLVQGQGPRQIARNLVKEVDISRKQAETIARTEIIRVHAEGQLDAFERLGVEEIGVAIEWSTAGDSRVCKLCSPMDGVIYKTKEAHGLIPRHPNCRCAFLPANLGEAAGDQTRGKARIEAAMKESIQAEMSKANSKLPWAQQKQLSRWVGADAKIDKERTKEQVRPSSGKGEEPPKPKRG